METDIIQMCYSDLWPEGHEIFQYDYPTPWWITFAKRQCNILKKIPPYKIIEN